MSIHSNDPENNDAEIGTAAHRVDPDRRVYRPIRDLDPRTSCLVRGMNMGVVFGIILGLVSGLFVQFGILKVPFLRLYGKLTGIGFYAVWTAICLCLCILIFELFSILTTPWRHLDRS